MNPDQPPEEGNIADLEILVLRALCFKPAACSPAIWDALSGYHFRAPLNQAVFDVLLRLRATPASALRAALLAELTRHGFPEVDLEPFFSGEAPSLDATRALARQFLAFAGRSETHHGEKPSKR